MALTGLDGLTLSMTKYNIANTGWHRSSLHATEYIC